MVSSLVERLELGERSGEIVEGFVVGIVWPFS